MTTKQRMAERKKLRRKIRKAKAGVRQQRDAMITDVQPQPVFRPNTKAGPVSVGGPYRGTRVQPKRRTRRQRRSPG